MEKHLLLFQFSHHDVCAVSELIYNTVTDTENRPVVAKGERGGRDQLGGWISRLKTTIQKR